MSTELTQAPPGQTPAPKQKKPLLQRVPVKRIIVLVVLAAGLFAFRRFTGGGGVPKAVPGQSLYTAVPVERRDLTASITGSGALEAADSYSVTTLLEDTILSAGFEEGDQVKKGDVLYTIDSSDAASSLEQAEISYSQTQRSYDRTIKSQKDLTVLSNASGRVYDVAVELGDEVKAGDVVATVRDSDTMELMVPFPSDDAAGFWVGQDASVTLDSTFETLSGTVSKLAGNDTVLAGGRIVREVTINVENPGALTPEHTASASVGGVESAGAGTFAYRDESQVTAKVSGDVAEVLVSEGDRVEKNQPLVRLTSDDMDDSLASASDSLRNAQISLNDRYERLEDYTITSPIDGTVIDKNYNAGETTEANKVLCTIYDLSYLTMTLNVDELDISDIAVGQRVSISADAVEGRTYEGVVTKVSVAGTSSGGVTTYPVTIRIDETEGLMPGMNVDATIVLDSAKDALVIPAAALQRGNTVLVTADSPSAANGTPAAQPGKPGENGENASGAPGAPDASGASGSQSASAQYYTVPVTVGVGDSDYIQILSGLQEGDTVAYIPTTGGQGPFFMGMDGGYVSVSGPVEGGPDGGPGGR